MNDALLMRVLNRATDLYEESNPFGDGQAMLRRVRGDRVADDVFHHDVREPRIGGARVVDVGDVRVIHHGEGLLLGAEARDDLAGIASRAQHLDRDLAPNGFVLLREVDGPHSAFAEQAHDAVGSHACGRDVLLQLTEEGRRRV